MSSKKFDVCLRQESTSGNGITKGTRSFKNNAAGFEAYLVWIQKHRNTEELVHIVEATGVYHENLCYFLYENSERVSVQLAQKAKYFIKSLNIKTKTDKVDAAALAQMGLSRNLELWQPISRNFKSIRDLSRTLVRLKKHIVVASSQIHAIESAHQTHEDSLTIMQKLLDTQKGLAASCEEKIFELVEKDEELSGRIGKVTQIKGINRITVIKLLAETDGFRNVKSIRSLVSYAGLDVVQNQSGMQRGKSRISKKGNAYIRTALYMPAMSAIQHDPKSKKTYERLNERLPKKKQSLIAVMRKLLITIYTLWKNNEDYNPNHDWTKKRRGLSLVTG
jgi:transposase